MKNVYRFLIWLHPPCFRRRFGAEMLWLYGEVSGEVRSAGLLADALTSLARQWLLRSGGWKLAPALCGGLLAPVLGLSLPSLLPAVLLPHLDPGPTSYAYGFFLLATFSALFTICGTVLLSVLWFGMSRRRRHA